MVEMRFVVVLAEKHTDLGEWLCCYLDEYLLAVIVMSLNQVVEAEKAPEWVEVVAGLYVHDTVVATIVPAEYLNQSAGLRLFAC